MVIRARLGVQVAMEAAATFYAPKRKYAFDTVNGCGPLRIATLNGQAAAHLALYTPRQPCSPLASFSHSSS